MANGCEAVFKRGTARNYGLKPVNSGEERCTPGHYWGAGVRGNYIIHYVISGKGVFYCGTGKYTLMKGQAFVIFPNTIVKYQADMKDPWHYAWVVFDGEEARSVFDGLGVTVKAPIITSLDGKRAVDLIRQMPRERGGVLSENLRFSSLLYEFLSLLAENKTDDRSENIYLNAATRFIRAHYHEDVTVESLAANVGISRKYLFVIFKNTLGISPKEYIIDYRMKKACEFLKDRNLSVSQVAYSVGYKDPLTFSRMFKTRFGVSPMMLRENGIR
ncbi:MAG: AraC family transcriptional regulator [Ruminococcaceae bacterium]|nr:AraC family transcriptional regulator [Oscillospiraceae bacterium]